MLTIIAGKDRAALLGAYAKEYKKINKDDSIDVAILEGENFSLQQFCDMAVLYSPFIGKSIFRIDSIIEEYEDDAISKIDIFVKSPHHFIFLETNLNAENTRKVEKAGANVVKLLVGKVKELYNPFVLANALFARNKKDVWALYRNAIDRGDEPEKVRGLLLWATRQICLGERGGGKYKKDETKELLTSLTYCDEPLETGLEKIILMQV